MILKDIKKHVHYKVTVGGRNKMLKRGELFRLSGDGQLLVTEPKRDNGEQGRWCFAKCLVASALNGVAAQIDVSGYKLRRETIRRQIERLEKEDNAIVRILNVDAGLGKL